MKKGYWVVAYHTAGDEATMKSYGELAVLGSGVKRDFRIAEGA